MPGDFPEDVEKDEVGGEHESHHGSEEQHRHEVVFVLVLVVADVVEGKKHDQRADQGGDDRHEHGKTVRGKAEGDAQRPGDHKRLCPPLHRIGDECQGARQ